jgi:hypothetical protein
MHAMSKLIALLSLLLVFTACSNQADQVAAVEKSRLTSEQIIDNKQCNHFKAELDSASLSIEAVNKVYDDATKAHCIKKDI